MGFRGTKWSKTQYYRRMRKAREIGCSVEDVPDTRGRHGNHARGNKCHRWSGDKKIIGSNGYVKIRVGTDHPLADPNGYAYEHLVVWVSAGRRKPVSGEVIHHCNHDKTDNRLVNLRLMTSSDHRYLHIAHAKPGQGADALGEIVQEFPRVETTVHN